jgi:type I restriction enzyme, S subunit
MSELPRGWVRTTVGEIAVTKLGKMLSAKAKAGISPRPYLRNKNVQWGRFDLGDVAEMDFTDEEFERLQVLPRDLLICEGGEVGRAAIWRGQMESVGYQKALHRVRAVAGVEPEFLLYLFMRLAQTNGFDPYVTGSTIKHLPQEDLREVHVPLPPSNEQRRIVGAVEEQFSRLDAAETSLDAAIRRTVAYREAVLAEAFSASWRVRKVGDVASLRDGPFGSNLKTSHYVDAGPRVIRLQNIGNGFFKNERAHISEEHFSHLAKHAVDAGDIVAASLGDDAPRACLVPSWLGPAIVKADCIRIRSSVDVEPSFLMWALNSRSVHAQAAARIKGIGRPRLGLGGIRDLAVPVPPIEEQRRVVADVERRLSVIDRTHDAIENARHRGSTLRRAILDRAFRGELVLQDPSDEPAAALLKRIAAERAGAERKARRKVPA